MFHVNLVSGTGLGAKIIIIILKKIMIPTMLTWEFKMKINWNTFTIHICYTQCSVISKVVAFPPLECVITDPQRLFKCYSQNHLIQLWLKMKRKPMDIYHICIQLDRLHSKSQINYAAKISEIFLSACSNWSKMLKLITILETTQHIDL